MNDTKLIFIYHYKNVWLWPEETEDDKTIRVFLLMADKTNLC